MLRVQIPSLTPPIHPHKVEIESISSLAFGRALLYNQMAMKFSTYFVKLEHPDASFTGNLLISGDSVSVNFKKVEGVLFIAHFQRQVGLSFGEDLTFKNHEKTTRVMLPAISKYNKRKLKKIAGIIQTIEDREPLDTLLELLQVEKFIELTPLLSFFNLQRKIILQRLLESEQAKKTKVIDLNSLYITAYDSYLEYLETLRALIDHHHQVRIQAIPFSEIEAKIKISRSSIYFKYLLTSLEPEYTYKILADKVLLPRVSISEKEKQTIDTITALLKKNKLTLFAMDNILDISALEEQEVNDALWNLVDEDKIIQLDGRYFIFSEDLNKIVNRLKKYKRNQGDIIDIKSFRELTSFNRRSIITLLEYFDSMRITQRQGDQRKILLVV